MQLKLFQVVATKKCKNCKLILTIDNFLKTYDKRDGHYYYNTYCSKCKLIIDRKRSKIYRKKNPEKYKKAIREWNKKNRDYINKYHKMKRETNYLFKMKCNVRGTIRQSIIRNGFKKTTKTANYLKVDWHTFKNYLENKFIQGMNWENFGKWHVDHKIPLKAASTEFEVIALNHYTNLQPMWAKDNIKKSDKYDKEDFKNYMDWYRKNVKSDLD